jgi:uncharacterized protein
MIHRIESAFPMVKIIKIGNDIYVYDAKVGLLSNLSHHELEIIYAYYVENQRENIPEYLKNILDKKLFSPEPHRNITPDEQEIDKIIDEQENFYIPRSLILEITRKCNLSCKYCLQENNKKTENNKSKFLDINNAYKAIDFYFEKYSKIFLADNEDKINQYQEKVPLILQWWGGEPFLAFDMIKKTKQYFEKIAVEKYKISKNKIIYGLTTNLTVFNDEILEFLVQNNVNIKISLDGNVQEHNTNRVFKNGKGTFNKVLTNLEKIINAFPDYAKKHVGIHAVLADNINIFNAINFIRTKFNLYTPEKQLIALKTSPQKNNHRFFADFEYVKKEDAEKIIIDFRTEMKVLSELSMDALLEKLKNDRELFLELQPIIDVEALLCFDNPNYDNYDYCTFSCPIGFDNIFVATDGNFYSCAKIGYSFPIGHVDSGLNQQQLKEMYMLYYKKINQQCKNCWAFRFCKICPAVVAFKNKIELPNKQECENIKILALIGLTKYIILTEEFENIYSEFVRFSNENYDAYRDSKPFKL